MPPCQLLMPLLSRFYTVQASQRLTLPQGKGLLDYIWSGIEANSGCGIAVSCPESGRRISYERLREASHNFSSWLRENCHGSLALLLPNSPESIVSALGALEAGVPLSAHNPESSPEELARALRLTRSPWVVTKSSLVHTALEAAKAVSDSLRQDYPIQVISVDDEIVFSNVLQFVETIEARPNCGGRTEQVAGNERTAFISTSWSDEQGLWAVETSADSLLASCLQLSSPHLLPGVRLATNLPFFTRYGLSEGLLRGLSAGAELVLLPPGGSEGVTCLMEEYKPAVASLVPSSIHAVPTQPTLLQIILSHPLPPRNLKAVHPNIKDKVVQHYGPPEGPVVFSERWGDRSGEMGQEWQRLGQPVAGTEVRVTAGGGEVGVMSEGEISVRGPQFGASTTWVTTGDTGYYDPEGSFYLTRAGGLSIDGLGVWPGELEATLRTHEGVVGAGVFTAGHSLVAAVVPTDPYRPPTSSELMAWISSRAAPHKRLNDVVFTSSLPLTESGRLDRALLAARYLNPRDYAAVTSV